VSNFNTRVRPSKGWVNFSWRSWVNYTLALTQERRKGMTQRVAAARAGIGERTARKYEKAAALPSQLKCLHDWKTRIDPFEEDWPWVVSELERDPALQGSTLFALLCERHPDRYWS